MFLSELQEKDIIDLETGANLGKMIDAEINTTGQIIRFTAQPKRMFKRFFKSVENTINYADIAKVGADVILVKTLTKETE